MTAPEVTDAMLEKVRGLLAMAERTDNPHEAEAFSGKAAELIDKYRIDVARLTPKGQGPDFRRDTISMAGVANLRASVQLLSAVASHYGVTVLIGNTGNQKNPSLNGDTDDIATVRMMFASLVIQRDRAVQADLVNRPSYISTITYKNSFAYGYASRIRHRLTMLRAAQTTEARTTGDSTALVLFDREAAVAKWLAAEGMKIRSSNLNAPTIDRASHRAGQRAADSADLGNRGGVTSAGRRAIG